MKRSWLVLPGLLACSDNAASRNDTASADAVSATAPDVLIDVRDSAISMPDTIQAGFKRVRVTEQGEGHIVVFFRLNTDMQNVAAFLAELDTSANTPASATAFGGPEIGTVGDIILDLVPGKYVVACVSKAGDHRHAIRGEAMSVVVAGDSAPSEAIREYSFTEKVSMVDFAYAGTDRWKSGAQLLLVVNNGAQDHQLRIARLTDGVTLRQVMEAADPTSMMIDVAGVARMAAGKSAILPVELTPGTYLLSCLVTDPHTRKQHVELGMLRAITVE